MTNTLTFSCRRGAVMLLHKAHKFFSLAADFVILVSGRESTYQKTCENIERRFKTHVRTRIRVIDYAKIESLYKTIGCG